MEGMKGELVGLMVGVSSVYRFLAWKLYRIYFILLIPGYKVHVFPL